MKAKIINVGLSCCPTFVNFLIANYYKIKVGLDKEIWGGHSFKSEIQRNLQLFLSPIEQRDSWLCHKLMNDIIASYVIWGVTPNEYFTFNFRNRGKTERDTFASVKIKDQILIKYYGSNWRNIFFELEDKWEFYKKYSYFFKREAMLLDSLHIEDGIRFLQKHERCIAKPVLGQCGKGIHLINYSDFEDMQKCKTFLQQYKESYLLEELIEQDPFMARWNASSVNTIRIASINNNGTIKVLFAFLKTGRAGSCTDNGGSGGIIAVIDHTNGEVSSNGQDEFNNVYELHPDSMCEFEGIQIPRWKELLNEVVQVHSQLAHHRYIGFDYALSIDRGWVMVEANWGAFQMYQSILGVGMRSEFSSCFLN